MQATRQKQTTLRKTERTLSKRKISIHITGISPMAFHYPNKKRLILWTAAVYARFNYCAQ
jgi:hypothetical protein